jgi:hypothetical protein
VPYMMFSLTDPFQVVTVLSEGKFSASQPTASSVGATCL